MTVAVVRPYRNGVTMGTAGRNPNPPPRGDVTGWSAGSVRRHSRRLFSIDADDLTGEGFALTLTLRDLPTQAEWFALRVAWTKRVERMEGFLRLHWVVEWQERGVPHMHCAVYGDGWGPADQRDMLIHWCALAGRFGAQWAAQDGEPIRGRLGWLRYLSKHAARGVAHYQRQGKPEGWEKTGRLYGFRGQWPFVEPEEVELLPGAYHRLRRLVRSWRIAEARAALASLPPTASPEHRASARRRIASARTALRCSVPAKSARRGMSEWCPEVVVLALLDLLRREGRVAAETAEEARTRVLSGLPTPQEAQDAAWTAVDDVLSILGASELPAA